MKKNLNHSKHKLILNSASNGFNFQAHPFHFIVFFFTVNLMAYSL